MQASSPEERAVAIEAAAQGVLATLQWRQKRKFMTPQQLHPWDQLVSCPSLHAPERLLPQTILALPPSSWDTCCKKSMLPHINTCLHVSSYQRNGHCYALWSAGSWRSIGA